jgi:flagellar biosynthesis chaperone FliJ
MKRFVWRLQRVLDIKIKEEQAKKAELLKLIEKLAETRGELLVRKKILEDIINGLAIKKPRQRLGEQELFLRSAAINDEQIKKLKEKIRELELQQRAKLTEFLRVRRFREGLEKLRAEAKREFIQTEERLEQKEMDEQATISYVRKKQFVMH